MLEVNLLSIFFFSGDSAAFAWKHTHSVTKTSEKSIIWNVAADFVPSW